MDLFGDLFRIGVPILGVVFILWCAATGRIERRPSPQQQLMLDEIDLRLEEFKAILRERKEDS